jgi:tetratricopeptide (TPR) repeat protein
MIALVVMLVRPAMPQAAGTAEPNTPEALKTAYDQAVKVKDWPSALANAHKLVDRSATAEHYRLLGDAQLYSGTGAEAIATLDRALAAAEKEKPAEGQPEAAWKDQKAKIYMSLGNANLKQRRNAEAIEHYQHAAELAANPGLAYFNICAVLYNTGDMENGPAACRKAAAADPMRANTWFILGSFLFANAPVDSNRKVAISDEGREALKKYLELAPDGPHAADVEAMLKMAK